MAHFNVCIIVKNDGSSTEQLAEKASAAINAFSYEVDVAPYKRYVENYQIEGLKKHHNTDDLSVLVREAGLLYGEECQSDENGIYYLSTSAENPQTGHFDYGTLLGRVLPKDWEKAFLGGGGNRFCHAIVTLEGEWIDGPWIMFEPNGPEQKKEIDEWVQKLQSVLEEHAAEAIFIADCHR